MQAALLNYLRSVLGGRDLGEVFARHFNAIDGLVGADGYAIYLFDADPRRPLQTIAEGVSDTFLESYEDLGRDHDPLLGGALDRQAPFHDRMIRSRSEWSEYAEMMNGFGYSHAMVAPVPYDGELIGTVNFIRRDDSPFRATDGGTIQKAAEFLGIAVGHALERGSFLARVRAAEWMVGKLPGAMVIATDRREVIVASEAIEGFDYADELREALIDASVEAVGTASGRSRRPVERRWGDGIIRSTPVPDQDGIALAVLVPDASARPRFDGLRGLLTAREVEVLEHAASGLHDKEIATTLHLSIYTVKQHLKNAYAKLGVRSRTEAADKAHGAWMPESAEDFLRFVAAGRPSVGAGGSDDPSR